MSLAKEKANLVDGDAALRIFEIMAQSVHPMTLGEIHRTHSLIRVLARKLLGLHMADENKIDGIIASLTEKLFSHGYKIHRSEARDELGLPVESPDPPLEALLMDLREQYVLAAEMDVPYSHAGAVQALAGVPAKAGVYTLNLDLVFVESEFGRSTWAQERVFELQTPAGGKAPVLNVVKDTGSWKKMWY